MSTMSHKIWCIPINDTPSYIWNIPTEISPKKIMGFTTIWYTYTWDYSYGSVSKPCTPVVHIKIAGKWMFIPLKMVCIGIDPYPYGKYGDYMKIKPHKNSLWYPHLHLRNHGLYGTTAPPARRPPPHLFRACEVHQGQLPSGGTLIYSWYMANIWLIYGWYMANIWLIYGWYMVSIWLIYGWYMVNIRLIYG